jgi:hypothetical protein
MNEHDPYRAPAAEVADPEPMVEPRLRRGRIALWICLLYVAPALIGLVSGLTLMMWQFYGETLPQAAENARVVRVVVIVIVGFLLYLGFVAGVRHRPVLHVAIVFVAVELLSTFEDLLLWRVPPAVVFDASNKLAHAGVAALALATMALLRRRARARRGDLNAPRSG